MVSAAVTAQQKAAQEWSLAQLSEADRAFVAAFAPTVEIPLPGGKRRALLPRLP